MTNQGSALDPSLLAQLPPVGLKALRVVEGAVTGQHQSPHHGQSIEFSEHKEYSPGDEIRHIDWKLFAKSDKYYVKQFEDETNLRAYLLLDASASMAYPERSDDDRPSKFSYSAVMALSIAYALLRQRDAVGLYGFSTELKTLLPPKSRPSYLLPMAQEVAKLTPTGETGLEAVVRQVAEVARRRSLLILFSDLFADPDHTTMLLKQLAYQGHDVVLFHIMDPDELEFPFSDQTLFEDMEVQGQQLHIDAQSIRSTYLDEVKQFLAQVKETTQQVGIEYWQIDTRTPPERLLHRFLLQRNRLKRRRR